MILEAIRQAIKSSGKSRNAISKQTGIDPVVLHRLVHGGSASIETIDKLCKYFGLELEPRKEGKHGKRG